ncbi:unnamed protein product, partial [Meganyctiphanes norvegica]
QVATKIRPVFNCSLKTSRGGPSLNEACYEGVNIMGDMLELIMLFRTNLYTFLADIHKAFLMIKLKHLHDRNKLCFFMRDGNKLICYRFTTLIFGLNASPFILNYIIKYHANQFPNDECTQMLLNNFFVDNMVKTHNSIDKLKQLYKTSAERMALGNFDLRSCNSNSEELRNVMKVDGKIVEHSCEFERVLGYKYSTINDTLHISCSFLDSNANSKRGILSQTAKIFDPLSLAAPVTVRCNTLISSLWENKSQENHWNAEVSVEFQRTWSALSKDLVQLSSLAFPRYSLSEDKGTEFFYFVTHLKIMHMAM